MCQKYPPGNSMSTGCRVNRDCGQGPQLESTCNSPGKESRGSQRGQEEMKSSTQVETFISDKVISLLLKWVKDTSTSKDTKNYIYCL